MKETGLCLLVLVIVAAAGGLLAGLSGGSPVKASSFDGANVSTMDAEPQKPRGADVPALSSGDWISLGLQGSDWALVEGPGVWHGDYVVIDHEVGTTTLEASLPAVAWPRTVELALWIPVHPGTNGTWQHRMYVEFADGARVYSDWVTRPDNSPLQLGVLFSSVSGLPVKVGQQFRSDGDSWLACWPETGGATSYRVHESFWTSTETTGYGWAGSTVVYTQTLTNLSGMSTGFTLTLGAHAWTTTLSITRTGVLSPDAAITLTARVEIPAEAAEGMSDAVILAATPAISPTLVSTATLTTRVPRPGYVFNDPANRVDILDTISHANTGLSIDTTPYGNRPFSGSYSPDGRWLYVTLFSSSSVLVISATTHTPVMTIPVGTWPTSIAFSPDGRYAFVVNQLSNSVSVIDVNRQSITTTIPVGSSPYYVAASPCLRKVYVTNTDNNSVSVIDLETLTVTNVITGQSTPIGVTFSPQGDRAYVANQGTAAISVIDTANESVMATWPVLGAQPFEIAPSADGAALYIGERRRVRVVSAVGPGAGQVITDLPINAGDGYVWGVGVFPWSVGPYVYATDWTNGTVIVASTQTNSVIKYISVPGSPRGLALFPPPTRCLSQVYLPVVLRR